MKQSTLLRLTLPGLAMITLAACNHKSPAHQEGGEMSVEVAMPVTDSITIYKTYPGYISANTSAAVVGRVNGTLLTRTYDSGSLVKKGQVLFTIEPTKYRDAVQQASAALQTAKSEYEYASNQYAAMKKALESDAVSQMDVIHAQSSMEQAEAAIKQAQASLSTAQTNLGYCTVRAPITGHITTSTVDPGSFISGEGSPFTLAQIYDDSKVVIIFQIEDTQYQRMLNSRNTADEEVYRHVPLTFTDTLPHSYTADLFYTAPTIDKSTGTLELKAQVDNPYGELRDGMYVTVHLPYDTDPKAILVRDASIGTDQLGKYLYVVNDSDKVVYTPIKVGDLYNDTLRVVTEGITPQSRYVTSALLKVRNGMPVNPVIK